MKPLTVFTPTYNRAFCLNQLYQSLAGQTSQDFIWMVIDDGSTDDTREKIYGWIRENKIEIKYIFQQNQGMHGAHNTAYQNITTEFNTCIDSDDYMPDNAVEIIVKTSRGLDDKCAGLVGLDIDRSGNIIGNRIPNHISESTLYDLHHKHGINGDKKLVYRTSVVRQYSPYPIFPNETFVPLGTLYALIDTDYLLKTVNEPLVVVEYLADGSSKNILKQYKKNPRGFAYSRCVKIQLNRNFKEKFVNAMHLVSSTIFAKDFAVLKEAKSPLLIALAVPFGVLLNLYIRFKTR